MPIILQFTPFFGSMYEIYLPLGSRYDKTGGRLIGSLPVAVGKMAMAPDEKSFWGMLFDEKDGKIVRYATPTEGLGGEQAAPVELGAVTGAHFSAFHFSNSP